MGSSPDWLHDADRDNDDDDQHNDAAAAECDLGSDN